MGLLSILLAVFESSLWADKRFVFRLNHANASAGNVGSELIVLCTFRWKVCIECLLAHWANTSCYCKAPNSKRKCRKIWTELEQKNVLVCSIFLAIFIFINPIQPVENKVNGKRLKSRSIHCCWSLGEVIFNSGTFKKLTVKFYFI